MTVKLESIAIAEGFTTDSRGEVTLVGYNPSVITVEKFPATLNPVIVVFFDLGKRLDGEEIELRFKVAGIDGEDIFFNSVKQTPQPAPFPEAQHVQAIAQFPFIADKGGPYTIEVEVQTLDGETSSSSRKLRVHDNEYMLEVMRNFHEKYG
jgi:hypothetical protein